MKRVIKSSTKTKNKLVILLELDESYEQIAAGQFIKPVSNISKKFQLDDEQIAAYDDFINSIRSVLLARKFEIIEEYQSDSSYSYYIVLYPVTEAGTKLDAFEIEFCISDHKNKGLNENKTTTSHNRIFKSFIVGGNRYPSTVAVMIAVSEVCDRLKNADYSVLDEV